MRRPTWLPPACGVALAAGAIVVAVLATPALLERLQSGCGDALCADSLERPANALLDQLASIGLTSGGWATLVLTVQWLELLGFCALGVVLLFKRPSLLAAVTAVGLIQVTLAPFTDSLGEGNGWQLVLMLLAVVNQASLYLILALFPDGCWHPRLLKVAALPAIAAMSIGGVLSAIDITVPGWASALQSVLFLLLVVAQVHRWFRRSDWIARQQTTWVLAGFLVLITTIISSVLAEVSGYLPRLQVLFIAAEHVAFAMIGLGLVFAVLRYRLYDVRLVMWRTFAYSACAAAVLAAYFLLVALAGMSMAHSSASVVGIAAVSVTVVAGAWAASRVKERIRRRLYGETRVAAAMVMSMTDGEHGSRLAETIADTLAMPYVEVLTADGLVSSTHGQPPATGTVRQPVVDSTGETVGVLVLGTAYGDQLDRRHRRALAEVLPFVVLVLRERRENEILRDARAAAASSREDERRRLRRDLHDGVGPLLASQLITLDTIKVARDRGVDEESLYSALESQARSAIAEIRSITRHLRPPALDAGGLEHALHAEVARLVAVDADCRISLGDRPLPVATEVSVLRIVQEALTNVARHAGASRVAVAVTAGRDTVDVVVEDDGIGRGDAEPGVGTSSMRERAEELGGTLSISTGPDGHGTVVRGRLPL